MPDDNLYDGLVRLGQGRKIFRRKRKSRGADFSGQEPPTMQEINRGVWCKRCKKRHPYNGSKRIRLGTQYEKRGAHFVIYWLCPVSGDYIGEICLGRTGTSTQQDETLTTTTIDSGTECSRDATTPSIITTHTTEEEE